MAPTSTAEAGVTSNRRLGPRLAKALKAPARLYDWDVGWILGRRFLRLTHVGRRSGRQYQTMLEVVGEDPRSHELYVIAGLGRSADWYRNLEARGAIEVAIARERFVPLHRELGEGEAVAILATYERRNRFVAPIVRLVFSRLVGWRYDGTGTARLRLVGQLPMIGLRPAEQDGGHDAGDNSPATLAATGARSRASSVAHRRAPAGDGNRPGPAATDAVRVTAGWRANENQD